MACKSIHAPDLPYPVRQVEWVLFMVEQDTFVNASNARNAWVKNYSCDRWHISAPPHPTTITYLAGVNRSSGGAGGTWQQHAERGQRWPLSEKTLGGGPSAWRPDSIQTDMCLTAVEQVILIAALGCKIRLCRLLLVRALSTRWLPLASRAVRAKTRRRPTLISVSCLQPYRWLRWLSAGSANAHLLRRTVRVCCISTFAISPTRMPVNMRVLSSLNTSPADITAFDGVQVGA